MKTRSISCPLIRQSRTTSRQSAFTLIELMVSIGLGSLLLVVGLDIFMTAIKATSRSAAEVSATSRGSIAIARIIDMSRECYALSLPTDPSGFVPPVTATTAANYITTDGSAAALQLTAPSTAPVTVVNSAGVDKTSGTDFSITYAKSAGPTLTIYRSDGHGNPLPNTGQFLWEVGTPPGQSALPSGGCRLELLTETSAIAAGTPDAATFVRDTTSTSTVPAIDIHLIASDYSAVNNSESNENTTNQVVGKCVLLRNHP